MRVIFISGLLLAGIHGAAVAERIIPTVIKSAARSEQTVIKVPNQITVISREEIEASGATTVSDVLRGRAGLQITDLRGDGASTTISIRGFAQTANANILVLVDGRRLNHTDTRTPDLSHIALQDVERIEVSQGSAGTLYGNQAVGGVVNIITRKPVGRQVKLAFDAGSYSRRGIRFNASHRLENGFAWRLAAETSQSDGYRDHSARDFRSMNGFLSYTHQSGELFVDLQRVNDDLELPGAIVQAEYDADRRQSNAGFRNDFSDSIVSVFRLGARQQIDSGWAFEGEFTHRETDEDLTQSFRNNASPPGGHTRRDQTSLNPRLVGDMQTRWGEVKITSGIDAEHTGFDLYVPNAFGATNRSNAQRTWAIYTQATIPYNDRLSLTVGGRRASVKNRMVDARNFPAGLDVKDKVFVKTLGLNYQWDKTLRWYARRDENFRFAKVDEITGAPAGTILDTQTGVSYDIGLQWLSQDRFFDLGLYRLNLEDEIYFDPTVGANGTNVNLDKTLRYGFVISAGMDVNEKLNLMVDYTYTHAKFEAGGLKGRNVSGVSPRLATVKMNFKPVDNWDWQAELLLVSSKYAQGDNQNTRKHAPGYGIVNLAARYQRKQWELAFKMNNLANKEYAEFIADGFTRSYQPSPERNASVSVAYRFD